MRALLLLLCACDAASSNPGLDAMLQVEGAQFRPGAFPDDEQGPEALAVQAQHSDLIVGRSGEHVRGVFDVTARGR